MMHASMSRVRFDLPTPEGDTIEFWEAAREERLLITALHRLRRLLLLPEALLPERAGARTSSGSRPAARAPSTPGR